MSDVYYVLRYLPEVPLKDRFHVSTLGTYPTWEAAEDARQSMPNGQNLDVLERKKGVR